MRLFIVLLTLLAAPITAFAQGPDSGTLGSLFVPRTGKIVHYSSYDRNLHNADFRPVAPGQTFTLVDHQGAGIVRRWWITIVPRNNRDIQRQAILRCYWDGEEDPSVEAPVSDFFGVGFGEWKQYISLPMNMTSGGYNCYWPMPFHRSARITLENRSKVAIDALYFNIDIETQPAVPDDALYFHAQFRRANPTLPGKPVTLLETTGRGQYVGTVLSMQMLRGRSLGFLEGNERVTVDGEAEPSIIGTGTEDYFSSGWYFDTGVYSAPYHGLTIKDEEKSRVSAYRWHIEDAIPFTKSLRFEIEHGAVNDATADYSSVAFWYQTHPHPKFPPLPADLMPVEQAPVPRTPGMIEGESLVPAARATEGLLSVQTMTGYSDGWSGLAQLWWRPGKPGARLTLTLTAPETKDYELIGYFTRAPDYGDVQVAVNGKLVSPLLRGYNPDIAATGPLSFGRVPLRAGANEVTLTISGKDQRSTGYMAGIDGFVLKP